MDYKKKYEEAIERCKKEFNFNNLAYSHEEIRERLEHVFTELKDNDDEKIRKELLYYIQQEKNYIESQVKPENSPKLRFLIDAISWLEKQGEQKPTDKVEPKFKVGDYITNEHNFIMHIDGIDVNVYVYHVLDDNRILKHDITKTDESCHLWTIQDAKDGDVLVASDDSIFLFKSIVDFACKHYIALKTDGTVEFNEGLEHVWETSRAVHPATKEQCNLLFQKMKEAGYEWDVEKKELKKIEDEIEIQFGAKDSELIEASYYIPKGFHAEIKGNNVVIKKDEQKPTWSEEDERYMNTLLWIIEAYRKNGFDETHEQNAVISENWLKSIEERMKRE